MQEGNPSCVRSHIRLTVLLLISALTASAATLTLAERGRAEFMRFGKPLTAQNPPMPTQKLRSYLDAIAQEDGPTTCAKRKSDGGIDEEKGIDWTTVSDLVDLEVCLFFAASEVRDAERLTTLLDASGFQGINKIELVPFESPWVGVRGEGLVLGGGMPIKKIPAGFNGLFGTLWAYSLTVAVTVDQSGRPYNTQAILNYN